MATIYTYSGKVTQPNMEQIAIDVAASTMTDKAIDGCRWDKGADGPAGAEVLCVHFTNDLSGADKTILDTIVGNN